LLLDVDTANGQIGRWLQDIAHQRIHGTTGEKPQVRLEQERHAFLPLPEKASKTVSLAINPSSHLTHGIAMPYESLQHPLSVYDALLGVPA
jgi:hypothetical protein